MRFVNLTWAVTVYVEPARGGGLSYRDNSLGAIMKPLVPMSGGVQRIWVQFGEFLTGHRLVWMIALLCIVAAQPLASGLFRLVFGYLF